MTDNYLYDARCYALGFPNRCLVRDLIGKAVSVRERLRYTFMMAVSKIVTQPFLVLHGNPILPLSVRPEHDPMLENRIHAQSKRSAAPRELFLPVEVYISNQAAAALRKVFPLP